MAPVSKARKSARPEFASNHASRSRGRKPNSFDKIVAQQIRVFRLAKGISPETLAWKVGVTFQQISRYESGQNRVAAGTLCEIARALGVRIECFFHGIKVELVAEEDSIDALDLVKDASIRRLLAAWLRLPDRKRKALLGLID